MPPPPHSTYGSRPPSRDPYQQQASPSSAMPMTAPGMPAVAYMNDGNSAYTTMYGGGQIHIMPNTSYSGGNNMLQMHYSKAENNAVPYNTNNSNHQHYPYGSTAVGYNSIPTSYVVNQQQQPQHHGYHQIAYIPRKNIYDGDFGGSQSMHIRDPNISPQNRNNSFVQDNNNSMLSQYSTPRRTWGQPISIDQQQQVYQNMSSQPSYHPSSQQLIENTTWQTIPKRPLSAVSKCDDGMIEGLQQNQHHQQTKQQSMVFHHNGDSSTEMYAALHSSPLQGHPHHNRSSAGNNVSGGNKFQQQNALSNTQEFNSTSQGILNDGNGGKIYNSSLSPPDDMMAPQSICFIGDEDDMDELERNIIEKMQSTGLSEYSFPVHHNNIEQQHFNEQMYHDQQQQEQTLQQTLLAEERHEKEMLAQNLNITSGNLTYRIPSPQRRQLQPNSFQVSNYGEKEFLYNNYIDINY